MIRKCGLLIALIGAFSWAQEFQGVPTLAHEPVFPSDTQPADGQLLEAVCPGHVVVGAKVGCQENCPKFTGFAGEPFDWTLIGVTRGHFLSPNSDDAVLSITGCEPHITNFGGTILLSRQREKWAMLWYKPGVITENCHKVPVENPLETLVCLGGYGAQGNSATALYSEDLRIPTATLMTAEGEEFFVVWDNINAAQCDEPLQRGDIEKVEFGTAANGGPLVSVTAVFGKKSLTPEEKETCDDITSGAKPRHELDIFPATKTYHLEFFYDGGDFKPTPQSAATARLFER